ncbi:MULTISPECIES: RidA family protein [Pseudomonas]|jgi:enamine deaminase RidA (YjgF/YER057c/UK114 family)|uniref:RidA family protein n=3 Tax=Pseudomonas TaxID=286 RepID=A0AA42RSJ1_9PSED|nr:MULTISPECIES: RidA family protein [Pseudomonas]MDC0689718.1 RidA family protein [Mitsuaria sp. RG]KNX77414.1 endoribonuclease L-PSP [Pseudomonas sp. 250J]MBC3436651.1 RidA family protein [Pseudomonas sp. BW16M2]MCE0914588.1 RidA family protein [Pseudomonas sp. NMI760_13]MCP8633289.1 RidA family protein [Pseudomonas sp. DVZ6]
MTQPAAFALSNPEGLYDPSGNAYSHVAEVRAGSRLLYIAGQGGEDLQGNLSARFDEQARQALVNLKIALASRGATLEHVFKLTLLVVDHSEARLSQWVAEAERAWGGRMTPTCTLIPVPRLALDGMLVEVDAVAALPEA